MSMGFMYSPPASHPFLRLIDYTHVALYVIHVIRAYHPQDTWLSARL